jgi:hypothetical protein
MHVEGYGREDQPSFGVAVMLTKLNQKGLSAVAVRLVRQAAGRRQCQGLFPHRTVPEWIRMVTRHPVAAPDVTLVE